MPSLNVLHLALQDIESSVIDILGNCNSTNDLIEQLATDIYAPIVTAIQNQNVSTSVDFSPVISAINSMSSALQSAVAANNLTATIAAINAMSTAVQAAINAKSSVFQYTTATKSTIATLAAVTSAQLFAANPSRKGFTIYNNSTNSLYVCVENPANAANLIDFCGSNAGPTSVVKWTGPGVPTQAIYVIRNAGVGNVTGWEFT